MNIQTSELKRCATRVLWALVFALPCLILPAGSVAVTVNVDASSQIETIEDEIFGQNMSVYDSTFNAGSTNYVNAVAAMGTTQMRIPGGGYASMVDWANIEAGPSSNCGAGGAWMTSMAEILGFANAAGPGLKLQPIINYGGRWCPGPTGKNHTAAVAKAAAWVRYLNVTAGGARPAEFWEIGNETFFNGDPSWEPNGTVYGNEFVDYFNAMKAEDPSIKIGLQCQFDDPTWSQNALTAARVGGATPDFLIAHAYPMWKANNPADYNTTAANTEVLGQNVDLAATFTSQMDTIVSNSGYTPGNIPYWMTEYRTSVPETKANQWVDALWSAQFILEMARLGWEGANIWAIKNGYSGTSQSDYGLLRNGSGSSDDSPADTPRPTWYVFPYLSKVFGRNMVLSGDNAALVRTWSALDAAGDLTVFMVNNDPNAANSATVNLSGFVPDTAANQAERWTMIAAGTTTAGGTTPVLQRRHISVNGVTNPGLGAVPGTGVAFTASTSFVVSLPAASMVLLRIPRNNGPTATPTAYAGTPTFTITPTPAPCEILLNGGEILTENGTWDGTEAARSIVGSGTAPAGAVTQGSSALQVQLLPGGAGFSAELMNLSGFAPDTWDNFTQLKADVYIDPALVAGQGWAALDLIGQCSTCGKWWEQMAAGQPVNGGVNEITWDLDFSLGTLLVDDPISRIMIAFNRESFSAGNIYIDNLRLVSNSCFQPTPTSTPTVTATPYVGPVCDAAFNGLETLTQNGNWQGASAIRSIQPGGGAPAGANTEGASVMYVNITSTAGFQADFANLYDFQPVNLAQYTQLTVDIYATPALIASMAWNQLLLYADCAGCAPPKYFKQISVGPSLVAGANTVTFSIDPGLEATDPLLPADTITGLNLVLLNDGNAAGGMYLDNMRLIRWGNCFTATPTTTRTRTPTPAATSSPTPTHTPTVSETHSPTSSWTPAATSTHSPTSTWTFTSTLTHSPTLTWTPTVTLTRTPPPVGSSPTHSPTILPTATHTPTFSSTLTATPSFTYSPVNTSTFTPSVTPLATESFTPGDSPTFTPVDTATTTPVNTTSPTPEPTDTITQTVTPVSTLISTPTATASVTPIESATLSPTLVSTFSFTWSPTVSSTPAGTLTVSPTPPGTLTITPIWTYSMTVSPTPAATQTATRTATLTVTLTPTRTVTLTLLPTFSFTPLNSATVTRTVTPSLAPVLTGLNVTFGEVAGGTVVIVSGSNFLSGVEVRVDGMLLTAEFVEHMSPTSLRVIMPAQDPGWVDLEVSNPGPYSDTMTGAFEYRLPAEFDGTLTITEAQIAPHPVNDVTATLVFELKGWAEVIHWKAYTKSYAMVAVGEVKGTYRPGWNQAALDLQALNNGLWYLVIEAGRDETARSEKKFLKVMILR